MADDIRIDDTSGESDTLSSELREIESRFLQDSLVWGADLDGIERLTQLVRSLPGRKATDTAVLLKTLDEEPAADSVDGVDGVDATPDKRQPVKQGAGEQRAPAPWIAGIAALVIVALLAVVFSTLAASHNSGLTAAPTVTTEATATTEDATATATRMPTPTATATVPAPRMGPFTATLVIQPNGNNISAKSETTSCTSQVQFWFAVVVRYSYAPAGYVTFHWQHYDGNSPGGPATGVFLENPSSADPSQIPTGPPEGIQYQYTDQWTVGSADYTGSTARWGDQFVITAINGKTLATPIASNILHFPTGC